MKNFLCFLIPLFIVAGCKKEEEKKDCWQAFDPAGYDARGLIVCDKTKAEAEALYPQLWFYSAAEKKYCWRTQSPRSGAGYARHIPESMVEKLTALYSISFAKTACESFCTWTLQDKFQSKITGQFKPVQQRRETFQQDSCSKLFVGRVIVLQETADSIYTREFFSRDE